MFLNQSPILAVTLPASLSTTIHSSLTSKSVLSLFWKEENIHVIPET